MFRKGYLTLLLVVIAVVAGPGAQAALSYWSGAGTAGGGNGDAGAATLEQGAAPTAEAAGLSTVTVSWGASSLSTGVPADGYIVKRFDRATGVAVTIGAGCAGTVATVTCTESGIPPGHWEYSVTPVSGAAWRGAESVKSGSVTTGPRSLTLSRSLFGGSVAPLPAVVTGVASEFPPNQAISFRLDGNVILSGSPSQVGADGSATISVTLPAGIADGSHSLSVVSATAEASAAILVDNTAPTFAITVEPPPNAAGWNRTPVEVSGIADDGNGSGVAYAKYTLDGSNPKTSSTARYALGPVLISTSATLKFYLADNAGNESPVSTQLIKIDTTSPLFTVALRNVGGGAYLAPGGTGPGEKAAVYYRGAAAGTLSYLLTPLATGGSAAVSAGFSALTANSVGFSFDSSSVTTPVGGPFLSNPFSWVAGTSSTPSGTISMTNEAGSTLGAAGLVYNDSTAPSGGTVDAVGLTGTGGRYSTSLELHLRLARGTDAGSGLADGTGPSDVPDTLGRASAPLTSGEGTAEGTCGTLGAFAAVGPENPPAELADTVPVNDRCYVYRYLVHDHVGNVATYTSPAIKVVARGGSAQPAPSNGVLAAVTNPGAQVISGSTVFYNPAQSGSFSVSSSATSAYAGIARVLFPTITGFSGGGSVTSPVGGSTYRSTYSWAANGAAASPGVQSISATDNTGQTVVNPSAFTVVKDETGPTGGAVDAIGLTGTGGRYSTSTSLSIGFTRGSDAGAGLAASGARLLRSSASLTSSGGADGVCGAFGTFTQIGAADPTSPQPDTVPVDRSCYRYAYAVPDNVGNVTTYLSPAVKVDATSPPAPALSFSTLNNVYLDGTGSALFYRPAVAAGGFRVTATAADATAGISGYAFPSLPTGWSSSNVGTGIQSYSWSAANPVAPTGSQTVTVTNNAGRGASAAFTVTADSTPPSGGNVVYAAGYSVGSTVSVSFAKGTDTGSGLATASGIIEAASAPLAGNVCGGFGAFAVVATDPVSGVALPVSTSTCYQYRYSIADNVGNRATYTSPNVVKVDSAPPVDSLSLNSALNASLSGSTIFYRGNASGSFRVLDTVSDAASGPASATFPAIATTGWTHGLETVSSPAAGPYLSNLFSWTANPANPSSKPVFSTDLAGKSSTNTSLAFVSDTVGPGGGSISYPNGVVNATAVPITTLSGTDAASGINTATLTIKRDTASLNTKAEICGSFPGTFPTTVTLVGGADTSVLSGNCYRYAYLVTDNVGNLTTYTSSAVAKVDTSGPVVTAVESRQSNGSNGNGKIEVGDKLVITFNQSLASGSVPTTFSGATETRPTFGNVTLTIPGITSGALDTGSPFYLLGLNSTESFAGTVALANAETATTVTVTVTSISGASPASGLGSLSFRPASTITDGGGRPATGSFSTSALFRLF